MKIEDGKGSGQEMAINGRNEALSFSVTQSEALSCAKLGDSYNINTGDVSSIASGDATLLYFKNDESEDVIVEAFAVGLRGKKTSTAWKLTTGPPS